MHTDRTDGRQKDKRAGKVGRASKAGRDKEAEQQPAGKVGRASKVGRDERLNDSRQERASGSESGKP